MENLTADQMKLRAQIFTKANAVGQELGAMAKDGVNKDMGGFRFISYEHINARLRNLLPKYGLAIVPSVLSLEEDVILPHAEKDKRFMRSRVKMEFTLIDTETGWQEKFYGAGGASDYGDKSSGKAISEADKRFYFKLFHVSSFGDLDADKETVGNSGTNPSPLEWITMHADLASLARSKNMNQNTVQHYVVQGNFEYDAVKKILEEA